MERQVLADPAALAARAAAVLAEAARDAIASRGAAAIAVSGGSSPEPMLAALAALALPWDRVEVFQVDERIAPAGDAARNLVMQRRALGPHADRLRPMPVELADPVAAAAAYAQDLAARLGPGLALDAVHLGLGDDGHTASLVLGDPALDERSRPVTVSGLYQGHRRLTMTLPLLDRARRVVWLVQGGRKAPMSARLWAGDATIPAGRVAREHAVLLCDPAAVG